MGSVVFTIAIAAPWVGVVVAALLPASAGTVARAAAWATGTGALAAIAARLLAVLAGQQPPSGGLWAGDAVAVLMLTLVLWLSAVIQMFALRYLRGDLRQRWFAVWANALTGSTVVMVCAGTVVTFTIGWIAAGVSLVFLLHTYGSLPQARQGVRRTGLSFLIADAPLVVAVLVLTLAAGRDIRLAEVGSVSATLPEGIVVAVALLLVVAALGRSAQIPFHRWLPATLSAPTPVSALLHAGVVNAGAILVIRFSPLIAPVAAAMLVIFAAGAATLVYATAVRLVKPDVKGRLVFSTAGQMGFMMMAVGLGAFAAAIFHLIAHALYKSALFLSAGTGVANHAEQRTWPAPEPSPRSRTVAAVLLATALPVAVLVAAKGMLAPQATPASLALLGFVAFTAAVAVAAGLRRSMTAATLTAAAIGLTVLGFSYVAFLGIFEHLITPAASIQPASPWWLLIPAALLLGLELLVTSPRTASRMHSALYARTLAESTVSAPTRIGPARARQKEAV